jgi:putative mRNA 3-end processing factor
MLSETADGLYCAAGGFHIDPWHSVERAVITHAHGDHARPGSTAYLCAEPCVPLLARRLAAAGESTAVDGGDPSGGAGQTREPRVESLPYGKPLAMGGVRVSFHPAGHILGSAQVRIEGPDGVWVVSGDYKRAADPTCPAFEPLRCDTFITESTFGLPIYRWDAASVVIGEMLAWWQENQEAGRASILFCYTLGKAQRILAELAAVTDRAVLVHGMMVATIDAYRAAGVRMAPTSTLVERARGVSTPPQRAQSARRGPRLAGELILAPLSARGTPWMRRLGDFSDGFASGLVRVRGVRRQRGFDRGFVLSDHADWPALLETIAETGASRVLATHGHAEPLARHLAERGLESGTIRTAWEGEAGGAESA